MIIRQVYSPQKKKQSLLERFKLTITTSVFFILASQANALGLCEICNSPYVDPNSPEFDERHRLDVYLAKDTMLDSETQFPAVVWFHGGGFAAGDKNINPDIGGDEGNRLIWEIKEQLNALNIHFISVNYRYSGKNGNTIYTSMEDGTRAISEIARNPWVDPNRIVVMGGSSGAGIAQYVALKDKPASELFRVKGAILLNAQTSYDPSYYNLLGPFISVDPNFNASVGIFYGTFWSKLFDFDGEGSTQAGSISGIDLLSEDDPPVAFFYTQAKSEPISIADFGATWENPFLYANYTDTQIESYLASLPADMQFALYMQYVTALQYTNEVTHHPQFGQQFVQKAKSLGVYAEVNIANLYMNLPMQEYTDWSMYENFGRQLMIDDIVAKILAIQGM